MKGTTGFIAYIMKCIRRLFEKEEEVVEEIIVKAEPKEKEDKEGC